MARAQGARAQMALAFETSYGTPPVGGFTKMPFASTSLGAEQPLLNSELLGYGRDPLAPIKDAVTADGDVVVPLDAEAFGFWLKAAFGDPTTTGTGPWTHEFQSGSWTLPSMSIETGMPEVPRFAMYSGCVLDQINWQMQRSGLLTATARLVAQGETVGTTTSAGTPAALELQRFGHFNGAITRNGSALGNVVSADITYANNLDRIETIRSDGRIDGADPSIAALTGSIEVRFADQTLVTQAINGDPCELEFAYVLPSGESFTFFKRALDLGARHRLAKFLAAAMAADIIGIGCVPALGPVRRHGMAAIPAGDKTTQREVRMDIRPRRCNRLAVQALLHLVEDFEADDPFMLRLAQADVPDLAFEITGVNRIGQDALDLLVGQKPVTAERKLRIGFEEALQLRL